MASNQPGHGEPDFQIFSTLRYDPELAKVAAPADSYPPPRDSPYYLLAYHYDRMLAAANEFGWETAASKLQKKFAKDMPGFAATIDEYIPDMAVPWRLRILLYYNGDINVEAAPTTPFISHIFILPPAPTFNTFYKDSGYTAKQHALWELRLDTQPTAPSAFTKHKTTSRDMYNTARQRVNILSLKETVEVLIYNTAGEVMEGSITTVYFKKRHSQDGEWITPMLSNGGNAGTTRRYALGAGICSEAVVHIDELVDGEDVWLSNGARGFMPAVLKIGGN